MTDDLPSLLEKRISRRQFLFKGGGGETGALPLVLGVGAAGLAVVGMGSPAPGVEVQDEGSVLGRAKTLDFTGGGVTASLSGDKATVNVPTGGGGADHNFLSATHLDTVIGSPVQGDIVYANSTPAWTKLARPSTRRVLRHNTTTLLPEWSSNVLSSAFAPLVLEGSDVNVSSTTDVNVLSKTLTPSTGMYAKIAFRANLQWTDLAGQNPQAVITLKASRGNPPGAPSQNTREDQYDGFHTGILPYVMILSTRLIGDASFWVARTDPPNSLRIDVDARVTAGTLKFIKPNFMPITAEEVAT